MVYLVLAAYTLGLPATVVSRLLQNVFFAAGDTRTPARVAFLRLGGRHGARGGRRLRLDRVTLAAWIDAPGADRLSLAAVGPRPGRAIGAWFEVAVLRRRVRTEEAGSLFSWRAANGAVRRRPGVRRGGGYPWWVVRGLAPMVNRCGASGRTACSTWRYAGVSSVPSWIPVRGADEDLVRPRSGRRDHGVVYT